ncbi:hypothetical protein CR513_18354, partial [Mucuna pruriens]
MVNEIGAASNQRLENQLTELTSLMRQLAVGQYQPAMAAKLCDICTSVEHPTDMCPTLQETESDQTENGSNRIRIDHLIASNRGGSHFGQDRTKGHMQLNNSDPHRIPIIGKQVINNRLRNIKHHLSNSNNNSRECLPKATLHLWKT